MSFIISMCVKRVVFGKLISLVPPTFPTSHPSNQTKARGCCLASSSNKHFDELGAKMANPISSFADACDGKERRRRRRVLIIFDFDWSLIDCDSDTWVVDKLGASDLMASLRSTLPWTTLMDNMMKGLHAQGRTISDIEECLRTVPLCPEMIRAVEFAKKNGCDLHIVSDANSIFIQTILKAYKLSTFFEEVHTNPAHLDDFGVLRILPYHPSKEEPHGCVLCPPNMCKGSIVDRIRMQDVESSRICTFYVGDGNGDYCPSLRLTNEDHVFARSGFPLTKRIQNNPQVLKAKLHEWSSAHDLEVSLTNLLNDLYGLRPVGLASIDLRT